MKLSAAELEAAFSGLLRTLGQGFDDAGVPWMVVGRLAVSVWTEPGGTKDCDIALLLPGDSEGVETLLRDAGVHISRGEFAMAREGGSVSGR